MEKTGLESRVLGLFNWQRGHLFFFFFSSSERGKKHSGSLRFLPHQVDLYTEFSVRTSAPFICPRDVAASVNPLRRLAFNGVRMELPIADTGLHDHAVVCSEVTTKSSQSGLFTGTQEGRKGRFAQVRTRMLGGGSYKWHSWPIGARCALWVVHSVFCSLFSGQCRVAAKSTDTKFF